MEFYTVIIACPPLDHEFIIKSSRWDFGSVKEPICKTVYYSSDKWDFDEMISDIIHTHGCDQWAELEPINCCDMCGKKDQLVYASELRLCPKCNENFYKIFNSK